MDHISTDIFIVSNLLKYLKSCAFNGVAFSDSSSLCKHFLPVMPMVGLQFHCCSNRQRKVRVNVTS